MLGTSDMLTTVKQQHVGSLRWLHIHLYRCVLSPHALFSFVREDMFQSAGCAEHKWHQKSHCCVFFQKTSSRTHRIAVLSTILLSF